MQASATVSQQTESPADPDAAYWSFHDAVARAQLASWLPAGPGQVLIDISGPASQAAALAATAGHSVLHVTGPDAPRPYLVPPEAPAGDARPARDNAGPANPAGPGGPSRRPGNAATGAGRAGQAPLPSVRPAVSRPRPPGAATTPPDRRASTVVADSSGLEFLASGCADGLIAEDRTLSRHLATEALVGEIGRVLRPGGRVLASVESLTRGMAVLAEQHHWPHLVDLPRADVVLVPWPDGSITRCYGTEQLRELFTASGFEVNWIRPRTVLSPSTVSYLLARDAGSFGRLVDAELRTSADDSVGGQLVISATRR
ncbi:MAG TPA: methyltransferase [Trebonia sp.]|nr:methyltransferase [Trebonia sp.]